MHTTEKIFIQWVVIEYKYRKDKTAKKKLHFNINKKKKIFVKWRDGNMGIVDRPTENGENMNRIFPTHTLERSVLSLGKSVFISLLYRFETSFSLE